jgi:hypothetical protein
LLNNGDRWIYFSGSTETYAGKRNGGTEPVEVIESAWAFGDSCIIRPENAERLWSDWQYAYDFDSSRPIVATVERATVPPGAQLTPEEVQRLGLGTSERDVFRMIAVEAGTLEEVWVPDALTQSEPAQLETDNKRTLQPGSVWTLQTSLTPPEGWEREFRNASDEPMTLAIVAWTYGDTQDASDTPDQTADREFERTALLDHHFAADAVPRDNASMFVMNRALVPSGDSVAYPSSCGAPTLMTTAVESGVYSIQAESRLDITRADGTVETIEPATPVELAAGDSFTYANATAESLSEFSNAGSEPLALLQAIWFPEADCTYGQPGSEDRSQIVWLTYDRLPALELPRAFDLTVQNVAIPNSFQLLDEEITGFAVPQFPNDNLARMAFESGTVIDNVTMVTGNVREQIFTERYGTAAVLSLDDPLALGDNFERRLTPLGPGGPTGEEPVEVTLFSLIYAPDTG